MTEIPQIMLHDGTRIPQLGFGTYKLRGEQARIGVETALALGYRHIDTAELYENEAEIGAALRSAGVPRDQLYLTTKVWNDHHQAVATRQALEASLTRLGTDHVDLCLIHWPAVRVYGTSFVECWNTLQQLRDEGLTTSIGVSNFHPHHLDALTGVVPVIDQVEAHPRFNQQALRDELATRGIRLTAWSPLGRGTITTDPVIAQIVADTGRSWTQVVLRWHLQIGNVVIPRSADPDHIAANLDCLDFELTSDQLERINALSVPDGRVSFDPDEAEF